MVNKKTRHAKAGTSAGNLIGTLEDSKTVSSDAASNSDPAANAGLSGQAGRLVEMTLAGALGRAVPHQPPYGRTDRKIMVAITADAGDLTFQSSDERLDFWIAGGMFTSRLFAVADATEKL